MKVVIQHSFKERKKIFILDLKQKSLVLVVSVRNFSYVLDGMYVYVLFIRIQKVFARNLILN